MSKKHSYPELVFLKKNSAGFTLIELLIVIAIIAVIAGVVFIALNPLQRFKDARNARRFADTKSIVDAVRLYQIENKGLPPPGLDANWRMLGTASSGCDILCGSSGSVSNDYNYSTQGDFASGNYLSTQWSNSNSWMELISPNASGSYTSPIIDSNTSNTVWSSLTYTPQFPNNKELPNNAQSETAYLSGNANMSGNILLMHFNESAGATTIQDSSGNSNNGTCSALICPTLGDVGRLNSGVSFNGTNNRIILSKTSSFNNITVSAWVKPIIADATAPSIAETIYDVGVQNNTGFHLFYIVKYSGTKQVRLYWQYSSNTLGTNSAYYILGQANAVSNAWKYVSVSHDYANKQIKFYVNGVLVKTTNHTDTVIPVSNKFGFVGSYQNSGNFFNGNMDELSVFNRVLSDQEILDQYKRGATRLKLQVRSCADSGCSTESFIGPDGTVSSYYSELLNNTNGIPTFNLTNINNNQYFQYKATFETDNSSYSPELKSVALGNTGSGSGNLLQPVCLNLSSDLNNKLNPIPQDPNFGTSEKTYYAVNRDSNGRINSLACGAEGVSITASR